MDTRKKEKGGESSRPVVESCARRPEMLCQVPRLVSPRGGGVEAREADGRCALSATAHVVVVLSPRPAIPNHANESNELLTLANNRGMSHTDPAVASPQEKDGLARGTSETHRTARERARRDQTGRQRERR